MSNFVINMHIDLHCRSDLTYRWTWDLKTRIPFFCKTLIHMQTLECDSDYLWQFNVWRTFQVPPDCTFYYSGDTLPGPPQG